MQRRPGAVVADIRGYLAIRGKRVLVIEDGPTLTHGEMAYGAGYVAARRFGATEIIDPRPFAVKSIAATYEKYPKNGPIRFHDGEGWVRPAWWNTDTNDWNYKKAPKVDMDAAGNVIKDANGNPTFHKVDVWDSAQHRMFLLTSCGHSPVQFSLDGDGGT